MLEEHVGWVGLRAQWSHKQCEEDDIRERERETEMVTASIAATRFALESTGVTL